MKYRKLSEEFKSARRIRKAYIGAVLGAIIVLLSANLAVLIRADGPTGFGTVYEPGSMVASADQILFRDGATYYSRNGTTGEIEYTDVDADDILQDIADSMTSGTILVKKGEYETDGYLALDGKVGFQIIGEGSGTNFVHTYFGNALFYMTDCQNIRISNLKITGTTNAENHGIWAGTSTNVVVENCVFDAIGDEPLTLGLASRNCIVRDNVFINGPSFAGGGGYICIQSGQHLIEGNTLIMNPAIQIVDQGAIQFEAMAGTEAIDRVIITNNYIENAYVGINLQAILYPISNITIEGNQIFNSFRAAIRDSTSGVDIATDIIISNNLIAGCTPIATTRAAIQLGGASGTYSSLTAVITGNIVRDWGVGNTTAYAIQVGMGSGVNENCIISNNIIDRIGAGGIRFSGENSTISGNTICDADLVTTNGAIYLSGSNNSIISNTIENGALGVRIVAGGKYNQISLNTFSGITSGVLNYGDATNKIRFNIGWLTETSGNKSVTGAVNFVTFNHYLKPIPTTPTLVLVTPVQTGYGNISVTASGLTITITFSNQPGGATWYFHWYAQTW